MLIHVGFGEREQGHNLEEGINERKWISAEVCLVQLKFQCAVWLHIVRE